MYNQGDENSPLESRGELERPLDANAKNSIYINEPGLYSLILGSKKPEAKAFKRWVSSDVLPAVRKTASYLPIAEPPPTISRIKQNADYRNDHSFNMHSENDLHFKVVDYIRRFHPHAKMTAGLGEFQRTSALRIEGKKKGYEKGTADLTIINNHLEFRGFCIEFKTPKGSRTLSESQDAWPQDLHINGYKVLVSNDYDTIIKEIAIYDQKVRFACPHCIAKPTYYKTEQRLNRHVLSFHKKSA